MGSQRVGHNLETEQQDEIKMRFYWISVGLNPMANVLTIKGTFRHRHREKTPCENKRHRRTFHAMTEAEIEAEHL